MCPSSPPTVVANCGWRVCSISDRHGWHGHRWLCVFVDELDIFDVRCVRHRPLAYHSVQHGVLMEHARTWTLRQHGQAVVKERARKTKLGSSSLSNMTAMARGIMPWRSACMCRSIELRQASNVGCECIQPTARISLETSSFDNAVLEASELWPTWCKPPI